MKEILEAMKATNAIFEQEVIVKRNYAALEQVYTADARILPPGGELVRGREAIIGFWSAAIPALGAIGGSLSTVEATQAGDGVVEIGAAQLKTAAGEAALKYVVYWKQEDGRWKWHTDIWNANA
jgi:ketosteroid isomerase-like protein